MHPAAPKPPTQSIKSRKRQSRSNRSTVTLQAAKIRDRSVPIPVKLPQQQYRACSCMAQAVTAALSNPTLRPPHLSQRVQRGTTSQQRLRRERLVVHMTRTESTKSALGSTAPNFKVGSCPPVV